MVMAGQISGAWFASRTVNLKRAIRVSERGVGLARPHMSDMEISSVLQGALWQARHHLEEKYFKSDQFPSL